MNLLFDGNPDGFDVRSYNNRSACYHFYPLAFQLRVSSYVQGETKCRAIRAMLYKTPTSIAAFDEYSMSTFIAFILTVHVMPINLQFPHHI